MRRMGTGILYRRTRERIRGKDSRRGLAGNLVVAVGYWALRQLGSVAEYRAFIEVACFRLASRGSVEHLADPLGLHPHALDVLRHALRGLTEPLARLADGLRHRLDVEVTDGGLAD